MTISRPLAAVPPPRSRSLLTPLAIALAELKPGQARLITPNKEAGGDLRRLATRVLAIGKRQGVRLVTRKQNGSGLMVYRVR